METPAPTADYRGQLSHEYLKRRSRNARYSVRSFARQLGVSKTALYEVLAGKRHLSVKNARQVANRLVLSPSETEAMLSTIKGRHTSLLVDSDVSLRDDTFLLMADWYHYAILNLIKLKSHRADPRWIAARLGISSNQVAEAVSRLQRLGFIRRRGNKYERLVGSLDTRPDFPSEAVRRYHRQQLHLAEQSLERDPVDQREFCSLTLAIAARDFPRVQKCVREFRHRISKTFSSPDPDQVCQLAMQFFPVTRKRGSE